MRHKLFILMFHIREQPDVTPDIFRLVSVRGFSMCKQRQFFSPISPMALPELWSDILNSQSSQYCTDMEQKWCKTRNVLIFAGFFSLTFETVEQEPFIHLNASEVIYSNQPKCFFFNVLFVKEIHLLLSHKVKFC